MTAKPSRYVPLHEVSEVLLSTLAADSSIFVAGLSMDDDVFIARSDICIAVNGVPGATDGPLVFGIADGSLTAAEVSECIETDGPLHSRDNDKDETSRRRVQVIGVLNLEHGDDNSPFNKGWYFQHKTRTTYVEDNTPSWNYFIYNLDTVALTDGMKVKIAALHHARWTT